MGRRVVYTAPTLHLNSIMESAMPRKYTPEERAAAFWSKVNKDGPTQPHMATPCWEWTGTRGSGGYGRPTDAAGNLVGAHRVAHEYAIGPIPDGLFVLHACDYPPCVRPDHLRAGTRAENIADAVSRGHMGGPRPGAGRPPAADPRTVAVMVRLTAAEAAALDKARGTLTRAAFVLRATLREAG